MSRINEGGHPLSASDAVLEFQHRRDSWVAARFGLKRRWTNPRLPLESKPRYYLKALDAEQRNTLVEFMDAQEIHYSVLSDAETKKRQADDRQALQSAGSRVRGAE